MIYITLHQTEADYNSLVLDESNTPHVAYIIETQGILYNIKINNGEDPEGYKLFNTVDGLFLDKNGNQIYVK